MTQLDLEIEEIAFVDDPANIGARIVFAKRASNFEALEGVARLDAIQAAADREFAGNAPSIALGRYLAAHPEVARLHREALSQAAARGALGKRAGSSEERLILQLLGNGKLIDLGLAAEMEESLAGPGPDELFEGIQERAAKVAGMTPSKALDAYVRSHPEEHARYRLAFRKSTVARVAYVEALYEAALEPLLKALAMDALSPREAAAVAWASVPGLRAARQRSIELAKRGKPIADLVHGHDVRCEMVKKLAVTALRKKLHGGAEVSVQKALEDTLAGDVALRREMAAGDEGVDTV